jgi:hypothetical protein
MKEEPMTTDDPKRHEDTTADERTGGAWIGQHPDANTEEIEEHQDPGAERVAVTSNEAGAPVPDGGWPHGHREGAHATDDDIREAGEDR